MLIFLHSASSLHRIKKNHKIRSKSFFAWEPAPASDWHCEYLSNHFKHTLKFAMKNSFSQNVFRKKNCAWTIVLRIHRPHSTTPFWPFPLLFVWDLMPLFTLSQRASVSEYLKSLQQRNCYVQILSQGTQYKNFPHVVAPQLRKKTMAWVFSINLEVFQSLDLWPNEASRKIHFSQIYFHPFFSPSVFLIMI